MRHARRPVAPWCVCSLLLSFVTTRIVCVTAASRPPTFHTRAPGSSRPPGPAGRPRDGSANTAAVRHSAHSQIARNRGTRARTALAQAIRAAASATSPTRTMERGQTRTSDAHLRRALPTRSSDAHLRRAPPTRSSSAPLHRSTALEHLVWAVLRSVTHMHRSVWRTCTTASDAHAPQRLAHMHRSVWRTCTAASGAHAPQRDAHAPQRLAHMLRSVAHICSAASDACPPVRCMLTSAVRCDECAPPFRASRPPSLGAAARGPCEPPQYLVNISLMVVAYIYTPCRWP